MRKAAAGLPAGWTSRNGAGAPGRAPFLPSCGALFFQPQGQAAFQLVGLQAGAVVKAGGSRWRQASDRMMAEATETLKLWIMPYMGM